MSEQSSDPLTDSLNDQCRISEINGESKMLFYANSDFSATSTDQVSDIVVMLGIDVTLSITV